ncbi:hypothetical protein [Vagococcus fluvialis]|nr:hypothetical protein [Vagococcus fluvialis]
MSKNKQMSKIVQVKQWFKHKTYKNGTFRVKSLISLIAEIMGYISALGLLIKVIRISFCVLYKVLPFLIEALRFLENLASSLSYHRRRFFYGIY